MYAKTIRIGFASWVVLLLAMASIATAQTTTTYLWDNGGGSNNWGVGTNWGLNPPLNAGVNNVTPNAFFEELGLINNGNTVNVTTSQTTFSDSAADNATAAAGVTVDGVTAIGNGSKLNIASTGSLNLLTTYGANGAAPSATPTAGTGNATLNNLGSITIQPGGTLTVQRNVTVNSGTLTVGGVAAGGTLNAGNLNETAAIGAVNLLGSAIVNISSGSVLNGTTTITGPNVVYNTPSISMSATGVFVPDIRSNAVAGGTGHSVINVTGSVSMGGALRPIFGAGVTPQLGNAWTLWDASQMQGSIASAQGAGLATGLGYAIQTTNVGSVHGIKGQLTVENFLTAVVNRATGQVTIQNTDTSVGPGVTVTGYQIGSPGGAINPAVFTSAFGGGSWQTVNQTINSVGELNPTSNSTVGLSASLPIGNVYNPVQRETTFGTTPLSDVTFSYSRSDGRTVTAPVTYTGTGLANTLVLQIDPTDGKAKIVNDSVFNNVQFDGYQVTSALSSLKTTWNSFENQAVTGWQKATVLNTGSVAELNPTATTNLNAGQTTATMTGLYNTAVGAQDLVFTFRVSPVAGDYNKDGLVNAADYTTWRDTLGQVGAGLAADGNANNMIDSGDYTVWKNNFGKVNGLSLANGGILTGLVRYASFAGSGAGALGSSSVPEPSSLLLLALGGIATSIVRRHK
jgi:PEP-CTERM motif